MNSISMLGSARVILDAETARELMTPDPVSISELASVSEAISLLNQREISAVPVLDGAGRACGVLSRTDVVRHARECFEKSGLYRRDQYRKSGLMLPLTETLDPAVLEEEISACQVREVMTPSVSSVAPDTPALHVVQEMLNRKVHRLFVAQDGVLIGVISAMDVLRRLRGD